MRAIAIGLIGVLTLAGCSSPEKTGDPTVLMGSSPELEESQRRSRPRPKLESPGDDEAVGRSASEAVAAELGLVDRPELEAYLNALGQRLARSGGRGFKYRFQIVDQDAPNAFALPGGFVYVSRGLLALSNSEDELANVVGHEITHVAARHAAGRAMMQQRAVNPLMMPGIVLGAVLGKSVGEALTAPFRVFNAGYVASYSRQQEGAADRGGQALTARAGFDPGGMASFLFRLAESERMRTGFSRLPGFFDTHPATAGRAGEAAATADTMRWTRSGGIDRAAYLAKLNGLVVGPRASEGVFRGERFYHPDLDLTIRFPQGWKLVNAQLTVGAVSPKRDAQIFMSAPVPGDDPQAAAFAFLDENARQFSITLVEEKALTIGGFPAYRVAGRASTGSSMIGGQVTWIAYRGLIYRITAIAPAGIGRGYLGRARNSVRSFRPLTEEERGSFREDRLRTATARAGETLSALGERIDNQWSLARTAVMNSLARSVELEAGQLVKVAISEPYRPPS